MATGITPRLDSIAAIYLRRLRRAEDMSGVSDRDRIDDVSPGDVIAVDRGARERPCKVVFKEFTDGQYVVTLEGDYGETFQLKLTPGATIKRSLGSKWESAQSPTPNLGG